MDRKLKEKPKVKFDIVDSSLAHTWETPILKKSLTFLLDRCVGCGLCVACPWEAITLGPVQEVAAGRLEEAPLINIDLEKCTFCGLCPSICFFDSLKMKMDSVDVQEAYAKVKGKHEVDHDKCIPCLLCSKICPREAIEADLQVPKKEDLVKYECEEREAKGTIKVDDEKCSYCGLCEKLCDAVQIFWEEPKPPDYKPAITIMVDEDKCDYCGLCEKICPSEAVKVECEYASPRKVSEPEIKGKIRIDEERCVDCGLCAAKCPVEALSVAKPLKGKVEFVNLDKCDPVGCKNCFNICPTKAIYPPKKGKKIDVVDDYCVYCGACERSCPDQVIKVVREDYRLTEEDRDKPWEKARRKVFDVLVGKMPEPLEVYERSFKFEVEPYKPPPEVDERGWKVAPEAKERLEKEVEHVSHVLKDRTLRMAFEVGNLKKVLRKLKASEA